MVAPQLWLVGLVVALLACWGSYRHGRDVEAGAQALQRQSDIATTWRAARADVSTQARVEADRLRRALDASRRVQEIDRADSLPPRAECDWTADELRIAAARWCARYADHDPAGCMPHPMPPPADADQSPGNLGAPDGGLGSPMPAPPRPVR